MNGGPNRLPQPRPAQHRITFGAGTRPTPMSNAPRPTWVVEVEITSADAGKVERYAEMGVREPWRLHGRKGTRELRADFLALRPGEAPREFDASEVLAEFTPEDMCEAMDGVRFGQTHEVRAKAVARIVHRRQRESVRVREEEAPYHASPA